MTPVSDWPRQCLIIQEVHKLYSSQDPSWDQTKTAISLEISPTQVSKAITVADHLDDPMVASHSGMEAAYDYILQKARKVKEAVFDQFLSQEDPKEEAPSPLTMISRFLSHSPPLTTIQVGILLAAQEQKRTLSELSATLSRSETIIGVNVAKLADQGLLTKLPDRTDGRKYFVQLTSQGRDFVSWATTQESSQ